MKNKEYWDLIRKYPGFQGGFIWGFADQALIVEGAVMLKAGDEISWEDLEMFKASHPVIPSFGRKPQMWSIRFDKDGAFQALEVIINFIIQNNNLCWRNRINVYIFAHD